KIRAGNYSNIYVKTNLGLCKYDGNNWSVILPGVNIQTFAIASNGDVWIGRGDTSLLIKYDGVGYQYFPFYDPLWPGMAITYSIAIDTSGNIWFADNLGFGKFDGSSFTFYNSTTLPFFQNFNNFIILSD